MEAVIGEKEAIAGLSYKDVSSELAFVGHELVVGDDVLVGGLGIDGAAVSHIAPEDAALYFRLTLLAAQYG